MEQWHHFEWNHSRVLAFSCVVTLFPSNGKAEINAIETAAQPTAPLLYYTSSTYFTHWLTVPPDQGANSLKVCFRSSWICCEVTHFKHGHSDNIDCSGIFRRTHKWYILYETQKSWRCSVVFLLLAVWRDLKQGVKNSKRRLLICWENKGFAPVQRKLKKKHLSFLRACDCFGLGPLCEFHIISWNNDKMKPILDVHEHGYAIFLCSLDVRV